MYMYAHVCITVCGGRLETLYFYFGFWCFFFFQLKVFCFYTEVSKWVLTAWEANPKDLRICPHLSSTTITNAGHQFWPFSFLFILLT